MKCPHCDYVDGEYVKEENSNRRVRVNGSEGAFYELPVKLERNGDYGQSQTAYLYACPTCTKTFIE